MVDELMSTKWVNPMNKPLDRTIYGGAWCFTGLLLSSLVLDAGDWVSLTCTLLLGIPNSMIGAVYMFYAWKRLRHDWGYTTCLDNVLDVSNGFTTTGRLRTCWKCPRQEHEWQSQMRSAPLHRRQKYWIESQGSRTGQYGPGIQCQAGSG